MALRDGILLLLLSVLLSCAPAGSGKAEGIVPPSAKVPQLRAGLLAQTAEATRPALGLTEAGGGVTDLDNARPGSGPRPRHNAVPAQRPPGRLAAIRAADFLERLAVAAHPHYTDSVPQANAAGMLEAFRYLGVRNLRSEGPNPANQGQGTLDFLAQNGIRFLFITGGDPSTSLRQIALFSQKHPGSVVLIEGINEPNNHAGLVFRDKTGLDAAVALQAELYGMAKADPVLASIPFAGMASWPVLGSPSDLMNLHPYPTWARQPSTVIKESLAAQQAVEDRKKGFVITESGWHTLLGATNGQHEGVDEDTQARFVLNLVVGSVALGARYVAIYELYDEYPDPAGSNPERHYGLFRFDGTPKPAATALRNLTTLLRDEDENAASVPTTRLQAEVSANAQRLLLQHGNGDFTLILWTEPDLWDDAADRPLSPAAQHATLRLGCAADIAVFDPLTGTTPLKAATRVTSMSVALTGSPVLLRLSNHAGCGAGKR